MEYLVFDKESDDLIDVIFIKSNKELMTYKKANPNTYTERSSDQTFFEEDTD